MDLIKAMNERHSVRSYLDKPIEGDLVEKLQGIISECNRESGLNVQLVLNEPEAFGGMMAHYGKFSGVKNYVALIGKRDEDEKIGYYGEKIVLYAQALGLNTCWVALTFKKVKTAFTINQGEKLHCVIALGYGATQGVQHKSKLASQVSVGYDDAPESFKNGVKAALLAPTATNQQKFTILYDNGKISARAGFGFYTKVDLGIVKYHFELGSGRAIIKWC